MKSIYIKVNLGILVLFFLTSCHSDEAQDSFIFKSENLNGNTETYLIKKYGKPQEVKRFIFNYGRIGDYAPDKMRRTRIIDRNKGKIDYLEFVKEMKWKDDNGGWLFVWLRKEKNEWIVFDYIYGDDYPLPE